MISLSRNEVFFIDSAPLSFVKTRLSALFLKDLESILKRKKCVFDAVDLFFRSLIMCPDNFGYNVVDLINATNRNQDSRYNLKSNRFIFKYILRFINF